MKKILFLAIALVVSVCGAWAQGTSSNDNCVADLPTKASAQSYVLSAPRGTLLGTESDYLQSTCLPANEAANPFDKTAEQFQFLLFPVEGQANGFYIYNVGTDKFLGARTTANTDGSHTAGVAPMTADAPAVYYIWKHGQTGSTGDGYNRFNFNKQDWPFTIGSTVRVSGNYSTINMTYWNNGVGYDFGNTSSIDGGNAYAVVPAKEVSDDVYVDAYTKAYGKAPSYVEDQTQGTGTHGELTAADIIGKMTNVGDSYRVVARTVSGTSKNFWLGFTKVAANSDVVDADHILVITKVEGGYTVRTASGKYFGIANGSSGSALCSQEEAGSENIGVVDIVERTSGADTDPYNDGTYKLVSFKLANGNYLNCNNTDLTPKWFTGTGGYSLYCIYGIKDAPASYHYSVAITGAPAGETPQITVGEEHYDDAAEFDSPVVLTSSDITASEYDGYASTITVADGVITVTYREGATWRDYNYYDVKAKGTTALTAVQEGYIAILGMDQQSNNRYYLYDNGTKVQGKVWADKTPELVWYVKSNGSGKYSFRNFKTGKYMTITRSDGGALNTSNTETNLNFLIQDGYGFIDDGSYGVDVAWSGETPTAWSGHGYTASGSRRLKIYEVELMPAVAKAEITYNYVFEGDNVGSETFQATIGEAFPDPLKSFGGYTMSAKPEGNVAEAGSHTITLTYNGPVEFTTISEGAFAAGTKWYRMQNGNNNENGFVKYLNDESKRSVMTSTEGSTDDYLWCFVRKPHTTYFYLYNRMAGAEVALHEELSTNTGWAANHNQGFGVFKVDGANDMPLEFVVNGVGYTMKLAGAGVEGTCVLGKHVGSNLSIWGNSASLDNEGSRFTFTLTEPEAGSYTLNVGETGYATLYLDENVTVPEGVEVYLCTSEDGTKIDATAFDEDDVLQGYMGYVVKAEPNTNVEFTYTDKNYEGSLEIIDNVLFGVLVETAVTSLPVFQQTPYVLSVVQGHVGFYKFGGETLKANRAFYVPVGGAADVQGFVIDFGGMTTAINAAQQAQSQKASFDLQGRRVSKAVRGLFIQNGQKVIR